MSLLRRRAPPRTSGPQAAPVSRADRDHDTEAARTTEGGPDDQAAEDQGETPRRRAPQARRRECRSARVRHRRNRRRMDRQRLLLGRCERGHRGLAGSRLRRHLERRHDRDPGRHVRVPPPLPAPDAHTDGHGEEHGYGAAEPRPRRPEARGTPLLSGLLLEHRAHERRRDRGLGGRPRARRRRERPTGAGKYSRRRGHDAHGSHVGGHPRAPPVLLPALRLRGTIALTVHGTVQGGA